MIECLCLFMHSQAKGKIPLTLICACSFTRLCTRLDGIKQAQDGQICHVKPFGAYRGDFLTSRKIEKVEDSQALQKIISLKLIVSWTRY